MELLKSYKGEKKNDEGQFCNNLGKFLFNDPNIKRPTTVEPTDNQDNLSNGGQSEQKSDESRSPSPMKDTVVAPPSLVDLPMIIN
jgi:hypothetical protein